MKYTLIAFLANTLTFLLCSGQTLKKYPVGNSGCSIYTFCDPGTYNVAHSDDSSIVYTGECKATDSLTYGTICVKLKQSVNAGASAEELMIAYLDYLKTAFEIVSSTGYGKGHTMEKKPDARGIIDYWRNKDGDDWKIKSWSDGKYVAVMYVYAKGKMNETTRVNLFLDSFRFPGM